MRQPARSSGGNAAAGFQIPAPTGGWNTRDPLAEMPPLDAVYLDNFYPNASGVAVRKGSALYATLPAGKVVRSLLTYNAGGTTKKLFAAAMDGLYDLAAPTVVSSAATSNTWNFVNISTAGGNFLWACNGVDDSRVFDGANWTNLNGTSSPVLSGITSSSITNVCLHQTRLYLTKRASLSFFYLPVNSIAGAAAEFPCGALFRRGGYIVGMQSWTLDAGNGMDDKLVILTSEGEVAIYSGYDPSNAATWSLVGIFYIGKPVSARPFCRLGGDMCILTVSGIMPLSKALLSATVDRRASLTDKIVKAYNDYVQTYGENFGWEALTFPQATMLLINVPIKAGFSYQFVMNTTTGAWCRFLGWSADTFTVHDNDLYFAMGNKVYKAWTGTDDVGTAIVARAKTAFQHTGGRGRVKRITLCRPIFTASASMTLQLGLDTDYADNNFASSATNIVQSIATWDQAVWNQAVWTGTSLTVAQWRSVTHSPGRAFALRLRASVKGVTMAWSATDFIGESGGLL